MCRFWSGFVWSVLRFGRTIYRSADMYGGQISRSCSTSSTATRQSDAGRWRSQFLRHCVPGWATAFFLLSTNRTAYDECARSLSHMYTTTITRTARDEQACSVSPYTPTTPGLQRTSDNGACFPAQMYTATTTCFQRNLSPGKYILDSEFGQARPAGYSRRTVFLRDGTQFELPGCQEPKRRICPIPTLEVGYITGQDVQWAMTGSAGNPFTLDD